MVASFWVVGWVADDVAGGAREGVDLESYQPPAKTDRALGGEVGVTDLHGRSNMGSIASEE
jgi:hypothetical protein